MHYRDEHGIREARAGYVILRHFDCQPCRDIAYGRPFARVLESPATVLPGQAAFDFMGTAPAPTRKAKGPY